MKGNSQTTLRPAGDGFHSSPALPPDAPLGVRRLAAPLSSPPQASYMTTAQAAAYASVHPNTLYMAARRGEIYAGRAGIGRGTWRFMRSAIDEWMERGNRAAI